MLNKIIFKKKLIFIVFLIFQSNIFTMEDVSDKNQLISCPLGTILSQEIFEIVLINIIDVSKDLEEAISSIRSFESCDKLTHSVVDLFLHHPPFVKTVIKKLAPQWRSIYGGPIALSENCIARIMNTSISLGLIIVPDDVTDNFFQSAYRFGHKKISKFFFKRSCNTNAKNNFFHIWALEDSKMNRFCLENGVDVDAIIQGKTALIQAAVNNNVEVVALLLEFHANKDIPTKEKRRWGIGGEFIEYEETAYSLARKKGHTEIMNLLEPNQ